LKKLSISGGSRSSERAADSEVDATHALRARDFEAAVFDLDGAVTRTAAVHAAAWKDLFDAYLEQVSAGSSEPFRPCDADEDYRRMSTASRDTRGSGARVATPVATPSPRAPLFLRSLLGNRVQATVPSQPVAHTSTSSTR
jgi:beta-phosphoglucomutase-like phosphatase (HAD superfamily)